jgi:hypothetical protein
MSISPPSKRFIATTLAIAITIVLLFILGKREQYLAPESTTVVDPIETESTQGTLLAVVDTEEDVAIDTDNDGLEDWEESLWGTNPFIADTDDDGVSDFDEVSARQKQTGEELDSIGFPVIDEELTNTDIIARQLYIAASSATEEEGITPAATEILSEIVTQQVRDSIPQKATTLSELHIVLDTTINRSEYLDPLFSLLSTHILTQDKAAVINSHILDIQNPQSLNSINTHKIEQDSFIQGLRVLAIPQPYATAHLRLIHATENYRDILLALSSLSTDPLIAYGALYQYQKSVENIWNEYQEFDKAITSNINP